MYVFHIDICTVYCNIFYTKNQKIVDFLWDVIWDNINV